MPPNFGSSLLKSSGGMALATFASRLLGFVREVLMAYALGGGTLKSAWDIAFRIPNLTRRVLGEGALGSALIPLISHAIEIDGKDAARKKFSTILIWLTLLLAAITVLVSVPSHLIAYFAELEHIEYFTSREHVMLALKLTPVLMPYCIFICLIGVMSSLLNSIRIFFLPALASLMLNILIIGCLFLVCPGMKDSPMAMLDALGVSVLISGVLELILLGWLLWRNGMFPLLNREAFSNFPAISELWKLALPGIIGTSALQISVIVDTSIAAALSSHAAAVLTYSERLIYLPIGVFAVSFGTVSLSEMSRAAAQSDIKKMLSQMMFSLRNLLFITVPMAFFMFAFSIPIIRLAFYRGAFDAFALKETAWAFMFYVFGIPAFAAVKITVAGFYARKDMRTPMLISLFCVGLNIVLSLVLMWPLRQGGIALATVIGSVVNNLLLLYCLHRALGGVSYWALLRHLGLLIAISALALAPALPVYAVMAAYAPKLKYLPIDLLPLAGASIVFGAAFLALGFAFRMNEARLFVARILGRHLR